MSPIFLTPSGMPLSGLVGDLRKRLDCLLINVIDEDLVVTTPYTVYQSASKGWVDFPIARVRKIDVNGFEVPLVPLIDYTLDLAEGEVTLLAEANGDETVRVDYTFELFTDAELLEFLTQSAREVVNLLHRPLDSANINDAYKEIILKRAYTNAFKCLIEPTFNFFSVSVGGRTIDKTNIVDSITKIMTANEELLVQELNSLRNFNQTDRFE